MTVATSHSSHSLSLLYSIYPFAQRPSVIDNGMWTDESGASEFLTAR